MQTWRSEFDPQNQHKKKSWDDNRDRRWASNKPQIQEEDLSQNTQVDEAWEVGNGLAEWCKGSLEVIKLGLLHSLPLLWTQQFLHLGCAG